MSLSEELRKIDRDTASAAMFSTLIGIVDDPKFAEDQIVDGAKYPVYNGFWYGTKAAEDIINTTKPVNPDYLKGVSAGIGISLLALFALAAQADTPNKK